ncbi:hypothetical protein A3BBH6_03470 [Alistipes onderdonkii subsp. vulgaris]|nr:hypothetical protein A3BBH6_03470 [Alistipes onderdonkii subsp. vulgaris]
MASACLLAAGCSTENKTDETGYGTLSVNCTTDTSIDTASAEASGTPEAPEAGAFSLTVTGETGTQKWDTLTEFEQSQTVFRMGAYTVAIAHGDPADEPVFVRGGTRLTVTGTARRQSPTGTGEGPEVTFSAQTLDATTPRTCHIITYDAKNAGSATLTITLGDSYTDTRTLDCEVNEGAIDDTEKK